LVLSAAATPVCTILGAGLTLVLAACTPTTVAVGAGSAVGVTAAQERGVEGAASDIKIRFEINRLLLQKSTELFLDVNLQVQEGRVLLSGTVPDPQSRVDAVRLAWLTDGVREVINEIEITEDGSFADFTLDRTIEAKIRAKLLGDREVVSLNYSIEAVNQSVYLIGVAQSQAELDRVIAHAKDVAYVRRVVSYVLLKDDPARGS
jgi:osmotically-inducible protein OsmY